MRGRAYLKRASEGVQEYCKEDDGTALEEMIRIILQVVEHTPYDRCHDRICDELRYGKTGVGLQALDAPPEAKPHLLTIR